jgi:hypothetical protein
VTIAADVGASGLVKRAWGWLAASGLEPHITTVNAYLAALAKEVRRLITHLIFMSCRCIPCQSAFQSQSCLVS